MRILITGGAGCLGSNLIEEFLPAGHNICILDNFATGKREAVAGIKGIEVVEGTIADKALVNRAFADFQPTHLIHSAAAYKDPDDWLEDVATNVQGAINVVEAAKAAGPDSPLGRFRPFTNGSRPDRGAFVPTPCATFWI